jgi:biotin carboxyl carrier protein
MSDKSTKSSGPVESPMGGKIDYDEIRKLVALLEEKNLSVFELEVEGLKVKIARNTPAAAPASVMAQAQASAPPAPAEDTGGSKALPTRRPPPSWTSATPSRRARPCASSRP